MSDEPLHDQNADADDVPMSKRAKAITWAVGTVLLLVVAFFMLRMSSPLIPANAKPPAGHFAMSCTTCHRLGPATNTGATP
jgi:hypothetical protein